MKVDAALFGADRERAAQLARPVREPARVRREGAPRGHQLEPGDGLERADEDGVRLAVAGDDDVESPVHPVDEVDVRVARRPEHRLGARGASFGAVCGKVSRAAVGLGLDDAPGGDAFGRVVHEELAEASPARAVGTGRA